ncbi:MAG: IS21 family transposase [Actinomycetota bacterium]|nr:IS21 family transposase [Actinomycetota bacterium]
MKSREEMMEILEAFDLTQSYRDAAELVGCSHHTVAAWVARRDAGELPVPGEPTRGERMTDPFLAKIEEWVERSQGRIRADVVADKLRPLGFGGSERTVRRAVAEAKQHWARGRRRVYRPWIPEPGMWAQWDWGEGPVVGGRRTSLFCAWLAWSRYRVVIPTWDHTLPTVVACLDRAMRAFGGVPTYWLTDNERTVTIDHVAGMAVRNPRIVAAAAHYGVTVASCVPADPESKGGSEATVRVAKADLVPTDANLRDDYASWAKLVEACEMFTTDINARAHRATRRPPAEMVIEERSRLHRLPDQAYTAAFGETRRVTWSATISFGGVIYSVPHALADETVWARVEGDELVVTHVAGRGATEVARHRLSTPGHPRIDDAHYPPRPPGALARQPKATTEAEKAFLGLGEGARLWLVEAAAAGTSRIKVKMSEAVTLAQLHGAKRVDWALGHAASYGRFAEGDVASVLAANPPGQRRSADEAHSLQLGTGAWEGFGTTGNSQ